MIVFDKTSSVNQEVHLSLSLLSVIAYLEKKKIFFRHTMALIIIIQKVLECIPYFISFDQCYV